MNARIRIIPWVMLVVASFYFLGESPNCIPYAGRPELPSYSGNCTESRNQEELPPS